MIKEENHPSLIVRLPNWVGDVVMTLPALQAMQQAGIELFLFGKPWAHDLLAATNMTLCSLGNNFWQTTKKISTIKNTHKALLLTNSLSSALMAYLAGKASIGYQTDSRRILLKASSSKPPALHEVQYFWNISIFASQFWFPQLQWPERIPSKISLPLNPIAVANVKKKLDQAKIRHPFYVLCPFAQGTGRDGQSKVWPHWYELTASLHPHQLIVCPGKNEEKLCSELVPGATILSGVNLAEYAAILATAEQVIANDSGPMHIAAAVGANTLGIFGVSDPQRSHPWGADYIGALGHWPTITDVLNTLSSKEKK